MYTATGIVGKSCKVSQKDLAEWEWEWGNYELTSTNLIKPCPIIKICSRETGARQVFPKTPDLIKIKSRFFSLEGVKVSCRRSEQNIQPMSVHVSKIRTEFRISWRQTGHLGATSRSTAMAHPWQHTRCPQGMKAERLLLITHMTHNCPSGTSSISSSSIWGSTLFTACLCCRSCLCSFHCFQLFQFLKNQHVCNCPNTTVFNHPKLLIISFQIFPVFWLYQN